VSEYKPGSRWRSTACETEIVLIRPPKIEGALECGGSPMLPIETDSPARVEPKPGLDEGTLLGKRYGDDAAGLEVLCSKGGKGTLTFAGSPIAMRQAKSLPASD
jgi:hypothetical protein